MLSGTYKTKEVYCVQKINCYTLLCIHKYAHSILHCIVNSSHDNRFLNHLNRMHISKENRNLIWIIISIKIISCFFLVTSSKLNTKLVRYNAKLHKTFTIISLSAETFLHRIPIIRRTCFSCNEWTFCQPVDVAASLMSNDYDWPNVNDRQCKLNYLLYQSSTLMTPLNVERATVQHGANTPQPNRYLYFSFDKLIYFF